MVAPRFTTIRRDDAHALTPAAPATLAAGMALSVSRGTPELRSASNRRLLPPAAGGKMRVLSVLSSANQMYSGIGRAVFELTARLRERVDFEFAIDDHYPRNVDLVLAFGQQYGIPVHVGPSLTSPRSLDSFSTSLPSLLRQDRWDLIEALCWANSATNGVILREIADIVPWSTQRTTNRSGPCRWPPMWPAYTDDIHHQMALVARMPRSAFLPGNAKPPPAARLVVGTTATTSPTAATWPNIAPGGGSKQAATPLRRRPRRTSEAVRPHPGHSTSVSSTRLARTEARGHRQRQRRPRSAASPPNFAPRASCVVMSPRSGTSPGLQREPGRVPPLRIRGVRHPNPRRIGLGNSPVFLTDLPVTRSLFGTYHGAKFCPGDDRPNDPGDRLGSTLCPRRSRVPPGPPGPRPPRRRLRLGRPSPPQVGGDVRRVVHPPLHRSPVSGASPPGQPQPQRPKPGRALNPTGSRNRARSSGRFATGPGKPALSFC